MLNNSTPLKFDCGALCGKACCEGDENTGMYLFPGEEIIFPPSSFLTIKPTDFKLDNGRDIFLGVCKGTCHRSMRPLSCRIFPLTPYISSSGRLEIKMDPRAILLCPIARYTELNRIDHLFIRRVRNVSQLLICDTDIRDFIFGLSLMLDDYSRFL